MSRRGCERNLHVEIEVLWSLPKVQNGLGLSWELDMISHGGFTTSKYWLGLPCYGQNAKRCRYVR